MEHKEFTEELRVFNRRRRFQNKKHKNALRIVKHINWYFFKEKKN